jgi:hypothetical protein
MKSKLLFVDLAICSVWMLSMFGGGCIKSQNSKIQTYFLTLTLMNKAVLERWMMDSSPKSALKRLLFRE